MVMIPLYQILSIRSYKLYYDDMGIWIYSGVFPWARGINGVKWRDLGQAAYHQSFLGWATKSYKIRISHRYTKSEEVTMSHTKNGQQVVGSINLLHQEYTRG
jgi:hypothetical protein